VNDLSGYSHGQNIRQMLGMMSRYPLLACRVLELEHTFNLADRAYAAAAAKKPRKAAGESKAAGGCDGGGSGAAGSAGALAGPSVSSALPDAGESTEVGTALPVAVEGSEVGTAFTDDSFVDSDDGTPASAGPTPCEEDLFGDTDMAAEEAAPTAFVPTIDWASWERRRLHWRSFNEIFMDGQVPLQLRERIRFEDFGGFAFSGAFV
jgi:hypothetical protein